MDDPAPAPINAQQKQKKGGSAAIIGCVVLLIALIGVSAFAFINLGSTSSKQSEIDTLTKQVEEKDKKIKEITEAVGIDVKEGEEVSTRELKKVLQECVDSEDKKKPLTDEQLVVEMAKRGYNVARRTIAKYRGQLGIPLARWRKEI